MSASIFELYYPQSLSPARLDRYLAGGWFRSRDFLYRSKMICLEGDVSPVINVRLRLEDYKPSRSLRKVLNKNKDVFRYEICEARIDRQKEDLYQLCKTRFKGMVVDSLTNFFFEFPGFSVFSTYELCVYHKEKLVAVSFFDMGVNSVASLLALYDPAYREYSLGMYTMLLEVGFAKNEQKKFFYPGYVIEGSDIFHYKLRLGNMQFYNWNGRWLPLAKLPQHTWITQKLKTGIDKMMMELDSLGYDYKKYLYPSFSLGYIDILPEYYLKSAVFLAIKFTTGDAPYLIIEYIPEDDVYRLCYVLEADMEDSEGIEISDEFQNEQLYYLKLLGYDEVVVTAKTAKEMMGFVMEDMQSTTLLS